MNNVDLSDGKVLPVTQDGPEIIPVPSDIDHAYVSTACHHELHARCRQSCKFCGVACACPCHEMTP